MCNKPPKFSGKNFYELCLSTNMNKTFSYKPIQGVNLQKKVHIYDYLFGYGLSMIL